MEYESPKLGTVRASRMMCADPVVQVQVYKFDTIRQEAYWVTKEVRTFRREADAVAYIQRIHDENDKS